MFKNMYYGNCFVYSTRLCAQNCGILSALTFLTVKYCYMFITLILSNRISTKEFMEKSGYMCTNKNNVKWVLTIIVWF